MEAALTPKSSSAPGVPFAVCAPLAAWVLLQPLGDVGWDLGAPAVPGWAAAAWPQHCPQGMFGGVRVGERWWERLGSWVGTAVVAEHEAVVLCPAACPDYQISQWEICWDFDARACVWLC